MLKTTLFAGVALGALSLTGPAAAQDGETQAGDVITVEATRLEQLVTETGSSVAIIDTETLQEKAFALDALATAPGVSIVQNGGFGGAASVRIRGAASEQTLVLIDGVPVNDAAAPGGGYDFSRLDSSLIERIEVLKGAQSTLWGTDAIGGVVSIVTKQPEPGLGGSLFGEIGSYGTYRAGAAVSGGNERGDFRLATTGVSSDGISKADEENGNTEEDGYDSLSVSARGGLNLPASARLEAGVLRVDADTEFDSYVFGAEGDVGDGNESAKSEEWSGDVTLTLPLFGDRLENMLQAGYSSIERRNFAGASESYAAEGERTVLRYQGTLAINQANTLAFGAEREDATADGEEAATDSLFALYELKPVDSLTLTAGVRNDDHETFGAETTARAAAAWNPTGLVTVRASWGEGFKAPTIFQMTYFCCGATEPNADLAPETSTGWDAGVDLRTPDGRGTASATYFAQDIENLITFDFAVGGYSNIAIAETSGIELSGAYELSDWWSVHGAWTWTDAADGDGNDLLRVPEHAADLGIDVSPSEKLSGGITVRYSGEITDSTGPVDAWTRVDLNGRYALTETLEVYGRVENLFAADYQQLLGYGTPGLSGAAGIRVRL